MMASRVHHRTTHQPRGTVITYGLARGFDVGTAQIMPQCSVVASGLLAMIAANSSSVNSRADRAETVVLTA
jgi:hypothetical protein